MTDATSGHVEIDHDGRLVAAGDIERVQPDVARVSLHVESGHLPPGTRARLVDAVLDNPQVKEAGHITAAVPRGDAETLDRVRQRCEHVETRPAGASIIVEAEPRSE